MSYKNEASVSCKEFLTKRAWFEESLLSATQWGIVRGCQVTVATDMTLRVDILVGSAMYHFHLKADGWHKGTGE